MKISCLQHKPFPIVIAAWILIIYANVELYICLSGFYTFSFTVNLRILYGTLFVHNIWRPRTYPFFTQNAHTITGILFRDSKDAGSKVGERKWKCKGVEVRIKFSLFFVVFSTHKTVVRLMLVDFVVVGF